MKIELHSNGKIQIQLTPETDIEAAYVRAFQLAAEKGQTVSAGPVGPWADEPPVCGLILSIEK